MSLADYLSKKYLSKDEPEKAKRGKSKKKKPKDKDMKAEHQQHDNLAIKVEDADDMTTDNVKIKQEPEYSDNEQDTTEAESKTTSSGGWRKVGNVAIKQEHEEYGEDQTQPRMTSGARAGLQTADEVQRDIDRRRAKDLAEMAALNKESGEQETVYRDVTGRRIDIGREQEELRRKEEEERLKQERFQRNVNKGDVQLGLIHQSVSELHAMKSKSMHQYANDNELNERQKGQQRANDPAAMFMQTDSKTGSSVKRSVTGLPVYKGPYEPNRFNIAPGYKWDGIDRSNGFEHKWFERQNDIKAQKGMRYSMSTDL